MSDIPPDSPLVDNKGHLHHLIEQVIDYGIFLLDPDGRVISWNEGATRIKGYSRDEIVGTHFSVFYPRELQDLGQPSRNLRIAIEDGHCLADGWRVRQDGSTFWCSAVITPLLGEDGDIQGFTKIVRDATRQQQTREGLRHSNARLRSILDTVPASIMMLSHDGTIKYINHALSGESNHDIAGANILDLLRPSDHAFCESQLRAVVENGESCQMEILLPGPPSSPMWCLINVGPIVQEEQITGLTLVGTDITRTKLAEEALEAREAHLQAVVDTAVESIVVINAEGIIFSFNPASEQIFGYKEDEVVGKNVKILMPGSHARHHDGYIRQYLETGEKKIIGIGREVTGRKKDGTTFPLDLAVSEFRHAGKRMFAGIIRDISERKVLERHLSEAAEIEQQRIAQDLHDGLGSQLSGIALLATVLYRKLEAGASPQAELSGELVNHVKDADSQLRRVAHGLMPVEVAASGLTEALASLARITNQADNLSCSLCTDGAFLLEDITVSTHLLRIAQEAVRNAIRHGHAAQIDLSLVVHASHIRLTIRDDGVGIGDSDPAASGLGLRTMRYRSEAIGALLEIAPVETGGTIVTCTLPLE